LVPSHAEPRDAADLQDHRLVLHRLLDRDDVGFCLRPKIVVVADPQMPVSGGGWPGHHVAAPALGSLRIRGVPELLDGRREELERVHAGAFGAAVELLEQPWERRGRGVTVRLRQAELLGPVPPDRKIGIERPDDPVDLVGSQLAHLDPHLVVSAAQTVELDRMRGHGWMVAPSSARLSGSVTPPGYGSAMTPSQVDP
jgi:hypothetical protein